MIRVGLADAPAPHRLHARLAARFATTFILESRDGPERLARYSFVGFDPAGTVACTALGITVTGALPAPSGDQDPLEYLRRMQAFYHVEDDDGPFVGGLVGSVGYDFARVVEPTLDDGSPEDWPRFLFGLYLDVIVYDHAADTITYVSRGEDRSAIVRAALARPRPAAPPAASGALDASAALEVSAPREASPALDASVPSEPDAAGPRGPPPGPAARLQVGRLAISADDDAFATSVRAAQELIRAGECFQVVLSRAFTGRFAGELGPLYAWLRDAAAVPYLYYLRFAPLARAAAVGPAGPAGQPLVLMGASPEMLVRVRHGQCETFPIAGTRPVTGHDDEDDDAADDLRHDRKECAEHAMLVDLARNDLSRVCTPGTVRVDGYQTVQRFRDVQHLVTRVTGTLGAGRDALDALAAVFPAGTVSGAPKVRAMEHIARLERRPRGPYAGAVAYVSFNGDLDSAIAIRSLSAVGDRLTVQAGAGIVNASEADAEARETLHKARTLLDGLQHFGATLPAQAERPRAPGAPPTRRAAASTVEAQR